jgi:hypothetical protein
MNASILAVTPEAASAIGQIVGDRDPTPGSGLRIARTSTPPGALVLSVARGPRPGDHVHSLGEAMLFVQGDAVSSLKGKVLDVEINQQGVALFSLTERTSMS